MAFAVAACGASTASAPRDTILAPTRIEPSARSLSNLHEDARARGGSQRAPFEQHALASAANAETLQELAIIPELIELSTVSGEDATEDLREALDAYHRWVRRNGVAPSAAAHALESSVQGPTVVLPTGTRPSERDEVATVLQAIAASLLEAMAQLERLSAAQLRVQNLEARSEELVRRIHSVAHEGDHRSRVPPGLVRSTMADVYRAMELEADVLAMAATMRASMDESITRARRSFERVERSIDCLSRGTACGGHLRQR
jgi:hypothetical protein